MFIEIPTKNYWQKRAIHQEWDKKDKLKGAKKVF